MAKHDRCSTAPPEDRRLDTHASDNTRSLGRDLPRNADVITNQDDEAYTPAPTRNGFFRTRLLVHEPRGQRCLRADIAQRRKLLMPVSARRLRHRMRDDSLPTGRSDAERLQRSHRSRPELGSLDGTRATRRSEHGPREVAGSQAERLLEAMSRLPPDNTRPRPGVWEQSLERSVDASRVSGSDSRTAVGHSESRTRRASILRPGGAPRSSSASTRLDRRGSRAAR